MQALVGYVLEDPKKEDVLLSTLVIVFPLLLPVGKVPDIQRRLMPCYRWIWILTLEYSLKASWVLMMTTPGFHGSVPKWNITNLVEKLSIQ